LRGCGSRAAGPISRKHSRSRLRRAQQIDRSGYFRKPAVRLRRGIRLSTVRKNRFAFVHPETRSSLAINLSVSRALAFAVSVHARTGVFQPSSPPAGRTAGSVWNVSNAFGALGRAKDQGPNCIAAWATPLKPNKPALNQAGGEESPPDAGKIRPELGQRGRRPRVRQG